MKTLNDHFSKIYCINMDSRPDRYELALEEFKKLNIDVERVSGIDGKIFPNGEFRGKSGAYGLLLTHIEILKESILNNYDSILILEDDVTFVDNFYDKFDKKISFLPDDWDLFYIGGNNIFSKGKFNLVTGDKNFIPTINNYRTLDHEICKTTWTQCVHALVINSKIFKDLINELNKKIFPIDLIHCNLQQNGCNAYTFLPSLALQRPGFSDIEDIFVDYEKDKANGF